MNRRFRRGSGALTAVVLSVAGLAAAPHPADAGAPGSAVSASSRAARPSGSGDPKVDPRVQRRVDKDAPTDFWIELRGRADLSAAFGMSDWDARGAYVVSKLQATARRSQHELKAELRDLRAELHPFWVDNSILVRGGTSAQLDAVLQHSEVREVRLHETHELPQPVDADRVTATSGVEWGVSDLRADQVWNVFDDRGEGVVVGSIDTGVQFDHPALVDQYRGSRPGGSIDHDYNWYDPSGTCGTPSVPCDNVGHGSHTVGTMVGDDGVNHIGVAPAAKWIAAKGCESLGCSEYALLASGQWMLAPTKRDGTDPDPSQRPMVINNSWGGGIADPWYRETVQAWTAAGIFPAFANGNEGYAGCGSVSAPGEYAESYGVGAYDIDGNIAEFSSLGPSALDGSMKPDASAPGVAVRSSVPGDEFDTLSGTSMATPHLSGVVALILSASPSLVGDVGGTRTLIDQTARDAPDTAGCGGTLADNNTFGEGRIDALAAVDASPRGRAIQLDGTVTDAATGDPVPDVEVELAGGLATRSTRTRADGTFRFQVSEGDYDLAVHGYGWVPQTHHVVVAGDTTENFALVAEARSTVTGIVRDGSGHGWPLYARIDIAGYPGGPVFTDPVTGRYRVVLVDGVDYELSVTSLLPGYVDQTRTVRLPADPVDQAFDLQAGASCVAQGYSLGDGGLHETFDEPTAPPGWTVVDNADSAQQWTFEDVAGRQNNTGGEGGFAIVDSDSSGGFGFQDTELISPSVDLSADDAPVLSFAEDPFRFASEVFDVDLSVDGGSSWTTIDHNTSSTVRGPRNRSIGLPQAAGEPDVRVRFHYYDAFNAWWWEVDDVVLGQPDCQPTEGGLAVGHTVDGITGAPVDGVLVTAADSSVTSIATPDDNAVAGGFVSIFAPAPGPATLTASKKLYADTATQVPVAVDDVSEVTLPLDAGHLSAEPMTVTTRLGRTVTARLEITNDGTADARVRLDPRDGGYVIASARPTAPTFVRSPVVTGRPGPADMKALRGASASPASKPPWSSLPDLPSGRIDTAAVALRGTTYAVGGYSLDAGPLDDVLALEDGGWVARQPMRETREAPGVVAIDGKIYALGGFDDFGIGRAAKRSFEIYDPETDSWSWGPDAPAGVAAPAAAALDGKAYFVTGCEGDYCLPTDGVMRYDPAAGTWQELSAYPIPVNWLSCAGDEVRHLLFCAGGRGFTAGPNGSETTAAFAYDPATDAWSPIADLPMPLWGSSGTSANGRFVLSGGVSGFKITDAGFAYDSFADDWVPLPPSGRPAYRGAVTCGLDRFGGFSKAGVDAEGEHLEEYRYCSSAPVRWLQPDQPELDVPAGQTVTLDVTLDASQVSQPGRYDGVLVVSTDTPHPVAPVPVALHVEPPRRWGRLTGQVTGLDRCDVGGAPLADAVVSLDGPSAVAQVTADGHYRVWARSRVAPWSLRVSAPGHVPRVMRVTAPAPATTAHQNVELRADLPCAGAAPSRIRIRLRQGRSAQATIRLSDRGAHQFRFAADEVPFAFHALPDDVRARTKAAGWFGGPPLPGAGARYAHAQCDGDLRRFYVIDGVNANHAPIARMERYDAASNTWTELSPPPAALESPTAVCEAGRIHLLGGSGTDDHFVYDIGTASWSRAAPVPRDVRGAAGAAWDGRIYLVGGDDNAVPGGTSGAVDVYDVATDTWSAGPAMPVPTVASGAAQASRYLYVVGGWDDDSPAENVATTQRLDLVTGSWSVGPTFTPATADFALAATNKAIYAMGGDAPGGTATDPTRATWRLPTRSWPKGRWTAGDELPLAMSGNSGTFCTSGFLRGEVWSVSGLDHFRLSDGETYLHGVEDERCAGVRGNVRWLTLSDRSGSVAGDGARDLRVTVDAGSLAPGVHRATVFVTTSDAGAPELRIPVRVRVRRR